jgi:hypothetical protein
VEENPQQEKLDLDKNSVHGMKKIGSVTEIKHLGVDSRGRTK